MNQILVTKKLYVTPELKRKKKIYKFDFFLSVFLVCILVSLYIYAEYDRNKSEEVSQDILASMKIAREEEQEDNTTVKNNILVVVLNNVQEDQQEESQEQIQQPQKNVQQSIQTTTKGNNYTTIASIKIPKIGIEYPILLGETGSIEETEDLLKISPCKFWGPDPNEVGNFCIVGHNYRNKRFFSKVPTLVSGDKIDITDIATGRKITYVVYDKYTVDPKDVSCTSQHTNGRKEITLITCTDDSKQRVIVKAREEK